ncbi:MAG TPA: hypothetical protein VJY39_10280, partial [Acidisphaera sp.]|nr:hypothetical protein [Acidisphaera sp.]
MLLAGDIGGTTTRLALISPEAGPRKFVAQKASSLLIMGSNETPLLGKPVLPTSSCFLVRLTGGR